MFDIVFRKDSYSRVAFECFLIGILVGHSNFDSAMVAFMGCGRVENELQDARRHLQRIHGLK